MTYIKRLVMKGFKSFPRETTIHFDRHVVCCVGPNGSGKCLTGKSLVQLANGSSERIENLVNSKLDKAVKTEDGYLIAGDGTEVMCLDMDSYKIIKKPIKAFVKRNSPKKLLKIKTRSGREVTTTKYHPLFILKDNDVISAKADELKKGVRIAVPRKINFEPEHKYFTELLDLINQDEKIYVPYREEYKLILNAIKGDLTWKQLSEKIGFSFYVVKGLLDKQSINLAHLIKIFRFAKLSDLESLTLISELISSGKRTKFLFKNSEEFSRFFGYLLAEGRLTESNQIWFTNGNKEIVEDYISLVKTLFNKEPLVREYKPNCWDVIIYSEPLKKILRKLGMSSRTGNKEISNIILKHSSNKEISNLLNGLYCGDGYISDNSVEITTKSNKLADGIVTCLLRLGIISNKKNVRKGIRESGFIGEYKNVIIYGVDNFKLFNENIDLVHQEKRNRILRTLYKKSNPNLDLTEVNNLIKKVAREQQINIKKSKKIFPRIDAYAYNQCLPSRQGIQLLRQKLLIKDSESTVILDKLINSNIYWDEIVEIEEINGIDWVYDLCVEKDHNFIANNIFVHNSNIVDALCFVLGRLSIKSIRAAKAAHLIFSGTKQYKPSSIAFVELTLDNSDKTFSLDSEEVKIRRIVKKNGQGVYKINDETKTRQEVLELLSQAGIDPHGFNIILQGEIEKFVKMPTEERRKIIEEVAGISVYEMRKAKSLRELEKTNEKLRQINAVLRERANYIKNLENEREQALRYKRLQETVKKCKASIINKHMQLKKKELSEVLKKVEFKDKEIVKVDERINKIQNEVVSLNEKIDSISKTIQEKSGLEQDNLLEEISEMKQDIAGLIARKESYENNLVELDRRRERLQIYIKNLEQDIEKMTKEKGRDRKKELEEKKIKLDELEEVRRQYYLVKSNLGSVDSQLEDKKRQVLRLRNESNFILNQVESLEDDIKIRESLNEHKKKIEEIKKLIEKEKRRIDKSDEELSGKEKRIAINKELIKESDKIKKHVGKLDICPLCKTKITKEHVGHVIEKVDNDISSAKEIIEQNEKNIINMREERGELKKRVFSYLDEIRVREVCIIKLEAIRDKKDQLMRNNEEIKLVESGIKLLEEKKKMLEKKISSSKVSEEQYENLKLEVGELQRSEERNLGIEITTKQRELDRAKLAIKQNIRDKEEIEEKLVDIEGGVEEKEEIVGEKEEQAEELKAKYQKMFDERNKMQDKVRGFESDLLKSQNDKRSLEGEVNNLKIEKAQINARIDSLKEEMKEFSGIEFLSLPLDKLKERLENAERVLERMGSVNMRALEVYDDIKAEYDKVREKVEQLEKERDEILRIIEQIDRKKRKTFLNTLKEVNELFSRNFSQLSTKGIVFLEPQDKKEIFNAGLDIIVKVGAGKYFDVTSLSGGEQTLVALSLIFAIQEFRPYCFYIFDEIDAALDKRNSERLAYLLKKHMKDGQYLMITHNDSIISESSNILYGVSMQEGVSKVLSLEV